MRFSNFSLSYLAIAAFLLFLSPTAAFAQARRIDGYALQVAALSSRRSADELVGGLKARGMNAYLVGGELSAALHYVRIGKFPTIAGADIYAENLVNVGLLRSYAIAAYESPDKDIPGRPIQDYAGKRSQPQIQKKQGRRVGTETIDVVAAIGSRGWLLLSKESINLTLRENKLARTDDSAPGQELISLAAAINSRGWSLNNNIAKFLSLAAPMNVVTLPSAIEAQRASSVSINAVSSISTPSNSGISSAPTRTSGYNPPPSLEGLVEMRDGRMWMTLRNADSERVFSGVARVSLSDDQRQEDVEPINITLLPDKEAMIPLEDARFSNGSWILMVYDQNGVARLIRGASLASPNTSNTISIANTGASAGSAYTPPAPISGVAAPPSYVTGVFDTTSWVAQPQISSTVDPQAINPGSVATAPAANTDSQNQVAEKDDNPSGQVVASLRQIAVNDGTVTLELQLSALNPINNLTVTLRSGDFQDLRQIDIQSSPMAVPFIVPTNVASTGIYYEIKDDAQRILTSGNALLRNVIK